MLSSEVCDIGIALLQGTIEELEAVRNNPGASVLQRWLAALICEGMTKADATTFKAVLDRLVDKPKEDRDMNHASTTDEATARIAAMSYEEKVAEVERLRRLREELGSD